MFKRASFLRTNRSTGKQRKKEMIEIDLILWFKASFTFSQSLWFLRHEHSLFAHSSSLITLLHAFIYLILLPLLYLISSLSPTQYILKCRSICFFFFIILLYCIDKFNKIYTTIKNIAHHFVHPSNRQRDGQPRKNRKARKKEFSNVVSRTLNPLTDCLDLFK